MTYLGTESITNNVPRECNLSHVQTEVTVAHLFGREIRSQTINQSINQSINQPTNQSVNNEFGTLFQEKLLLLPPFNASRPD